MSIPLLFRLQAALKLHLLRNLNRLLMRNKQMLGQLLPAGPAFSSECLRLYKVWRRISGGATAALLFPAFLDAVAALET